MRDTGGVLAREWLVLSLGPSCRQRSRTRPMSAAIHHQTWSAAGKPSMLLSDVLSRSDRGSILGDGFQRRATAERSRGQRSWCALAEADRDELIPIPLLPKPKAVVSRSHRTRARAKLKLDVWREANRYLLALNDLRRGSTTKQPRRRRSGPQSEANPAQIRVHEVALREARRLAVARLKHNSSVQPVNTLLKSTSASLYSVKATNRKHIDLIADSIDEPKDDLIVPLLEALPPEEAAYYSREQNLVEFTGKSSFFFQNWRRGLDL